MIEHETLGVYNYRGNKLCDLYDSQNDLIGQAYGITVTRMFDGTHSLTFKIPYSIKSDSGASGNISKYGSARFGFGRFGAGGAININNNFRWDYLKSDYLIRYTCGTKKIWFVANKPQKQKNGKSIYGTVTCAGTESLLKTRNIYLTFDDENGIGNIEYLTRQILAGTGWTYNSSGSDTLYEKDGVTEKIRSLSSDGKKGSLDLITSVCNLFQARPIYDTDAMTVTIKSITNREQVLEGVIGENLTALSVTQDSSNIATRVYIEGEYGDFGYVGIDDVLVDANGYPDENGTAYGLPFVMNFDYYREIGVFDDEHEAALATYMSDIRAKKAEIRAKGVELIACEDEINALIGQCRMAVYYKPYGYETPVYIYGDITNEQAMLNTGDTVLILYNNKTHEYHTWESDPSDLMENAYGVVKFATSAAGKVGAAEVQIESKQKEIENLRRKINVLPETNIKKVEYNEEIKRLVEEISAIYNGTDDMDGLYDMMSDVMDPNGLLYDLSKINDELDILNTEQDDIEATFISAMGYMLRDGSWSDTNYVVGQEVSLYLDAIDMAREMGRPAFEYSFSYVPIAEGFGISHKDIDINAIFRIYDEELQVNDNMFVKSVTYGVDDKKLGKIEVSNQDISLTGNDLSTMLSRMSQLADLIEQKNALYERAKSLSSDGSLYAYRLNGQIDVLRTKLLSTTSNWYTDDRGNIVFLSADESSAMMLSGAGFMLANEKNEDGSWRWRTFGTGRGIVADEIVAGFLSADRIEAGSITTSHLSSEVGASLDLSSNTQLNAYVQSVADEAASRVELTDSQFNVMFERNEKDFIDQSINRVQQNLDDYAGKVSTYMQYDNDGVLTLGRTDSEFKTRMTNKKLAFVQGNTEVAYISNQNMYITNANVTEKLSIGAGENKGGYFDWTTTTTGMGLVYRSK